MDHAETKALFAIARVQDPFSREVAADKVGPPLRIGQPVVAAIPGKILPDVHVIPRHAVRELSYIYLVDPVSLTLNRREIEPIWSDRDQLILAHLSLSEGSLLATSKLVYAPNLSRVEILPSSENDAEAPTSSGEAPPNSDPSDS